MGDLSYYTMEADAYLRWGNLMPGEEHKEKELLESFERDEWRPVAGREAEIERYSEYARATFKKDKRVNIRISGKDLDALKVRASEEGIPYQTLMASILHKYAEGRLVEKEFSSRRG